MRALASLFLLLAAVLLPGAGPRQRHLPRGAPAAPSEPAEVPTDVEDRGLAAARVTAAARLQAVEADADRAATQLDALSRRRAELQTELAARAAAMAPLLPLAERLRLDPAEALLAAEVPPDQALHGLLVLRGLAQRLEREAEALREEQAEVDRLSGEITAALPRLRAAQAVQTTQAAALDRSLAEARERRAKRNAADAAAQAAQRAAEQAAQRATEAATVAGALDRLDAARRAGRPREPAPAPTRRDAGLAQAAAPGPESGAARLAVPVAGRIVQGWGDPTDAGPAGGLTYRAPPQARVASPCGGRVAFAGPFRSFGLLLIVDCGRGVDVVMAGFDHLDAQVGQPIQAGEPVGVMPPWNPQAPGSRPGLYVELRKDGQRVDPAPFLRVRG